MMKLRVILHTPKTAEGKEELAYRVSCVHVDAVNRGIQRLNCPTAQKQQLLNSIIETVQQRSKM